MLSIILSSAVINSAVINNLVTKAIAAHKTPTEIIGELIREKIAVSL
jgi:hypothetical protein